MLGNLESCTTDNFALHIHNLVFCYSMSSQEIVTGYSLCDDDLTKVRATADAVEFAVGLLVVDLKTSARVKSEGERLLGPFDGAPSVSLYC